MNNIFDQLNALLKAYCLGVLIYTRPHDTDYVMEYKVKKSAINKKTVAVYSTRVLVKMDRINRGKVLSRPRVQTSVSLYVEKSNGWLLVKLAIYQFNSLGKKRLLRGNKWMVPCTVEWKQRIDRWAKENIGPMVFRRKTK
jgi:hypothetical protein